jgi:hypothetical protein
VPWEDIVNGEDTTEIIECCNSTYERHKWQDMHDLSLQCQGTCDT